MNPNLNKRQFVSHEDLAKMYSGDFDVPMSQHLNEAYHEHQYRLSEMRDAQRDGDTEGYENHRTGIHPGYRAHGSPEKYVEHLTKDIAENGMREPIEVRGGNVITDGQHRALAAIRLRLAQVPVRHVD